MIDIWDDLSNMQFLDAVASNLLDPNPIRFTKERKKINKELMMYFKSGNQDSIIFQKPLLRNNFLYNCKEFTKNKKSEYLIVGFGRLRGGGSDIKKVQIVIGGPTSVDIPSHVMGIINYWLYNVTSSEVVIFHNHPKGWEKPIFKNEPLPSIQDRKTAFSTKYSDLVKAYRHLFMTGGLNYYLEEDGKVKGFVVAPSEVISILGNIGNMIDEIIRYFLK